MRHAAPLRLWMQSPLCARTSEPVRIRPSVPVQTEIESSDVYMVILGGRYGYEHQDKESVTQQEFRHAISLRRPILIFVQDVEMEPSQAEFRNEVSAYHSGFCRERFSTPEELERKLIKNLLRLGRAQKACSQSEFSDSRARKIASRSLRSRLRGAVYVCFPPAANARSAVT